MLSNGTDTVMPVMPMNGYGNFGGFGDGFGGGWWVILFLFAMMGGGFGNWGFNGLGGLAGMDAVLPYFYNNQTQDVVRSGFDTQNLQSQINSVQGSVDNLRASNQLDSIQQSINTGFQGVEANSCNRFIDQLNATYQNQIADLNQRWQLAVATDDRIDRLSSDLQNCCCENRLATVQTQNVVNQQAAENRFQSAQNTRDIITNATANTQAILDKLCQLELDGVKSQLASAQRDNSALQAQLQMANLAASQAAQTAALTADNAAQTQYIVNRVAPYPIPAYQVGNPYAGYWNGNGCGCGCNNGVA